MANSLYLLLLAGILAVFTVALAIVVVVLARRSGRRAPQRAEGTALSILRERYARGEIGPEEFQRMREDLAAGRDA